ncbi:MAG: hypothetical protein GY930_09500 [bacterium]|nr:hypothetical protein [bacterium]
MMSYGYRTGLGSLGPPQLDFVVFGAAVGSAHAPTIDYGGDPSSQWEVGLTLGDGREIRIPDQTQLFGLVEGEFTRSEMHISFPEFWHYLHWDKDTHSLPELEEHVKRLREMLAE